MFRRTGWETCGPCSPCPNKANFKSSIRCHRSRCNRSMSSGRKWCFQVCSTTQTGRRSTLHPRRNQPPPAFSLRRRNGTFWANPPTGPAIFSRPYGCSNRQSPRTTATVRPIATWGSHSKKPAGSPRLCGRTARRSPLRAVPPPRRRARAPISTTAGSTKRLINGRMRLANIGRPNGRRITRYTSRPLRGSKTTERIDLIRFLRRSLLLYTAVAAIAGAAPQPYVTGAGTCDGYPRAGIDMAPGFCAGLVMSPAEGFRSCLIRTPRMVLQLQDGDRWLVTDLGNWTDKLGKVWLMEIDSPARVHLKPVLENLSLPHTIALGPDGKIYVGEMNRIFNVDVNSWTVQTVIDGLPGNRLHPGRHPLSHFIFDMNGDLLVNVGADTDQCTDARGAPLGTRCPEAEGEDARGVIRRYAYLGNSRWNPHATVVARGLRNSLVMVRHESGTLLQGENSYDFAPTADRP